jgi:glucose-6-phosphate 1-dehydrogenase
MPLVCTPTVGAELVPRDHIIVLFGGTGDLARRKLLPGLFRLSGAGLLPERYRIIATSRGDMTDGDFREFAKTAVEEFGRLASHASWQTFAGHLSFASLQALPEAVADAEAELGHGTRRLFYLSVPPVAFAGIVSMLGDSGLSDNAHVILEKPFGTDLASARALNETVHAAFDESCIFRIDHFLGKETVQNILALRFANGIFEPIWNRDHIGYVQIDVPETLSIGKRAAFYEKTGAYRDMIVTHLLQVLGFVAMEPPTSFSPKALLDETAKVAEALRPVGPGDVVYGQYAGYRAEDGVADDSQIETFAAARVAIDNWRWAGVPFYLRTGKRMAEKRQVVTIAFRDPPRRMFGSSNGFGPNELVFELGDPGRVSTTFLAKVPGPTMQLGAAALTFD